MVRNLLITPFQKFVKIESSSGILLFASALLALILANSPIGQEFLSLWKFKLGFATTGFELIKPLLLWINDGLMAIFFFLIGLEIKRELLNGELNTLRKASLPLFAAVGGMLVPVLLFISLNRNPDASHAWGIPMATDIAFSLAILTLLGSRVPIGLKVFLTAFAIVDDLGAVLIIALFYSGEIKWIMMAVAAGILAIMFFLSHRHIYKTLPFLGAGILVWFFFLKSGIHPTVAGVILAFTVPIRQKVDMDTYIGKLDEIVNSIRTAEQDEIPLLTRQQIEEIDNLEDWTEKVQSPLQHLEHRLHNWVAFLIMPVFALSNAGVGLNSGEGLDITLSGVIAVSLVAGKLTGVSLFSWIAVKLGLAQLPSGVNYRQVIGASLLAGVGFTMSIFIANLSFPEDAAMLDSAKIGILSGSLLAGIAGYLLLRLGKDKPDADTG